MHYDTNKVLHTVIQSLKPWWNSMLNLLYPTACNCIVCESQITEDMLSGMGLKEIPESRLWICKSCRDQVDFILDLDCVVCGRVRDMERHKKTTGDQTFEQWGSSTTYNKFCSECLNHNRPFELARAAIKYKGIGKDLIRFVKFEGRREPIEWMGEWLCHTWLLYYAQIKFDFIVPVPADQERLRKRGFNQALLLAEEVSQFSKIPILQPLSRSGSSKSQASRNRAERLQTLHGIYHAMDSYSEDLQGKQVLLVDDVFTTGATVEACTNELLRLGCKGVWVLSLAR